MDRDGLEGPGRVGSGEGVSCWESFRGGGKRRIPRCKDRIDSVHTQGGRRGGNPPPPGDEGGLPLGAGTKQSLHRTGGVTVDGSRPPTRPLRRPGAVGQDRPVTGTGGSGGVFPTRISEGLRGSSLRTDSRPVRRAPGREGRSSVLVSFPHNRRGRPRTVSLSRPPVPVSLRPRKGRAGTGRDFGPQGRRIRARADIRPHTWEGRRDGPVDGSGVLPSGSPSGLRVPWPLS